MGDDIFNNSINDIESKSDQKSAVHGRKINCFYKENKLRERIINNKERYFVNKFKTAQVAGLDQLQN